VSETEVGSRKKRNCRNNKEQKSLSFTEDGARRHHAESIFAFGMKIF
jgi:hypothetical protein